MWLINWTFCHSKSKIVSIKSTVCVCVFSQWVVVAPVHSDAGSGAAPSVGRAAAVGVNDHSVTWTQRQQLWVTLKLRFYSVFPFSPAKESVHRSSIHVYSSRTKNRVKASYDDVFFHKAVDHLTHVCESVCAFWRRTFWLFDSFGMGLRLVDWVTSLLSEGDVLQRLRASFGKQIDGRLHALSCWKPKNKLY